MFEKRLSMMMNAHVITLILAINLTTITTEICSNLEIDNMQERFFFLVSFCFCFVLLLREFQFFL